MTQIPPTTMISISHYIEKVKDGFVKIISKEQAYCPICQGELRSHGRCIRNLQTADGNRKLSLKVWYCPECHRSHRELPDSIIPYKRHCADTYIRVYESASADELDCSIDEKTIRRIRVWVEVFLKFAADILLRLKTEHPGMMTNKDVTPSVSALKYFVRIIVNTNEWKFSVPPLLPRRSVLS